MRQRTKSSGNKTNGHTYSDKTHSLTHLELRFLKVCTDAGKEGIIYSDVMAVDGMGQSSAATQRCNLLDAG